MHHTAHTHIARWRRPATPEEVAGMPTYIREAYERGVPPIVRLESGAYRIMKCGISGCQAPDRELIAAGKIIWLHPDGPTQAAVPIPALVQQVGVFIADPWTGRRFLVYPSGPLDRYPKGYFGDVFAARWEYFSPEEKRRHYEFQLELALYNLNLAKCDYDRDACTKKILHLKHSISDLGKAE